MTVIGFTLVCLSSFLCGYSLNTPNENVYVNITRSTAICLGLLQGAFAICGVWS